VGIWYRSQILTLFLLIFMERVVFHYLVNSGSITANTSAQQSLTMQNDSDFELCTILGQSNQDGIRSNGAALANAFQPNNFSVLITNQATGRTLANVRIPQSIIAPYGGYRLLSPIVLPAGTILLFDFLDLSGVTNVVNLVLAGYKRLNS